MFTDRADSKFVGPELLLESRVHGFSGVPARSPCSVDSQALPVSTESESRTEGRGVVQTGGLSQAEEALPDRHIALRRPGAEDGAGLRQPS